MKYRLTITAALLSAAALMSAALPARAQQLVSAQIRFDTLGNDKDHDTYANVEVLRSDGYKAASAYDIGGHYNNNSSHTVGLEVFPSDAAGLAGATLRIWINPNGNDKWEFRPTLRLKFDDRSERTIPLGAMVLTQDDSETRVSF
jgi:opacity protein-like surface antigen